MRTLLAGALLLSGVFAASEPARQRTANPPSRDWKRFTAAGLEVIGNARESDLKTAAKNIAAFRATLEALIPGLRLSGAEPTTLVVFRDHPSFTEFSPRDGRGRRQLGIAGYFSSAPDRNYLVLPVFADRRLTYEVVFHEYTHHVISRNFRGVPRWLNEGLAEFYSTFELDDAGRAIVGKVPSSRVWTLSTERLRPLRALLGIETGSQQFGTTEADLYYAQAWLFVHFMALSDGGKRQIQILKYLDLLTQTKSAEAAAREAFGTTLETLDREMAKYIEGFRLRGLRVSGVTWQPPDVETKPLTEADVAELKARLLLELDVPSEAKKYIDRALALEPRHMPGRMTHARQEVAAGRAAEASGQLEKISATESANFAAHYYLGQALYKQQRYTDAIAAYNRALKVNPRSSASWLQLTLTAMALGQYEQSDSAMAQLQEVQSAARWHYVRASEALKLGRYDAVLPDVKTFIDGAGIADESAPYAAFLGVIAARRTARPDDAQAVLTRVRPALNEGWPLMIARFLQGELSAPDLLRKAKDNGQRTEAHAYIGMHLIGTGQLPEARTHLEWVRDKGDRGYSEYELSLAELKRLDGPAAQRGGERLFRPLSPRSTRRSAPGPR